MVRAICIATALVTASSSFAIAGDEKVAVGTVTKDSVAGGEHWRIEASEGPIHVWRPKGYDHDTAGIVVYVHGFYTDVDKAWTEHELAQQFADSKQNALFIVPEAPSRGGQPVHFTSLGELIRSVRKHARIKRPWGHIVAMGHSGAYKTLLRWLDYRHLTQLILVDALYGGEAEFRDWLEKMRGHDQHRMTIVAADTLRWSEPLMRDIDYERAFDRIPERYSDIAPKDRSAKLLYMRAQYSHMALVTDGEVMPLLLRLTRLASL